MTDQETDSVIAASVGWVYHPGLDSSLYYFRCWQPPGVERKQYWKFRLVCPTYTTDLNAMAEAEETLGDALFDGRWLAALRAVVEEDEGLSCNLSFHHRATADQRARAFLRCRGLERGSEATEDGTESAKHNTTT